MLRGKDKFKNIIFDLGGVLIDWDPRHLLGKISQDEKAIEDFLDKVCNKEWNDLHDAGQPLTEARAILHAKHPAYSDWINIYFDRWTETLKGEISETVQILQKLKKENYALYALTNWSHETFPYARQNFPFLQDFFDIVVSGEEKIIKPDPKLFQILLKRNQLKPQESIFIDDRLVNVEAANQLGITGIQFINPEQLAIRLHELGVL